LWEDYCETIFERENAMKRIYKGLIVMAVVFLISPLAEAQMSSQDLVKGWKAFQRVQAGQASPADQLDASMYRGYVLGIADAASYYLSHSDQVTVEEACYVVGNYLDRHPERWHGPAIYRVVEAMTEALPKFPIKKK
jgi:hypothetical protein